MAEMKQSKGDEGKCRADEQRRSRRKKDSPRCVLGVD